MAIFAKIEGPDGVIEGEATDKEHDKWIEILSSSWSHHRTISEGARASQRTRGETHVADIVLACPMHKGSMKVQQCCAAGAILKKVEIHFCRAGEGSSSGLETYLTIKLENTLITGYNTSISGQDVPIEDVSLNASKIEMEYKSADKAGKLQTASAFTWDREKNQAA